MQMLDVNLNDRPSSFAEGKEWVTDAELLQRFIDRRDDLAFEALVRR